MNFGHFIVFDTFENEKIGKLENWKMENWKVKNWINKNGKKWKSEGKRA
jgi:hypothetical protein